MHVEIPASANHRASSQIVILLRQRARVDNVELCLGLTTGHRGRHAKIFGWAKSAVHVIDNKWHRIWRNPLHHFWHKTVRNLKQFAVTIM